ELGPMIREISEATAKAGTWVIPTLTIYKGIAPQIEDLNAILQRPEMKYVPKGIASVWQPERNQYKGRKREEIPALQNLYRLQELLVKGLRDAKVRLLAGSDAPATPVVAPGFSIHEELMNLVAAGLTPYEALRAATANAAEFLGAAEEFGTVAVGRRADLILVNANPLTDVGAAAQRSGVMVRGRWLPEAALQAKLTELANSTAKK
ncbi:MAG TPA: amidohydrolase family protein, partial [Blastocatellia bacterium]|nr:amidohydrolase family protein [Blastocatellia bacterium]